MKTSCIRGLLAKHPSAKFSTTFYHNGYPHTHYYANARDTIAWSQIIARSMQRAVRVWAGQKLIMYVDSA